MRSRVATTPFFDSRFKRFRRKFPSLDQEILELENQLLKNPRLGTDLGSGLFKIRLASKSKGGGKSGGFRVITYLIFEEQNEIEIWLLTIYDKSEESNMKKQRLVDMVSKLF